MQFGIFTVGDVTPDPATGRAPTEAERIASMVTLALKAEEVGLDVFASGEHHNPPFVPSSPTTMLGYIAARTERLILAPYRLDFYLQPTQFLVKHELYQQTLDLLTQADRFAPNSRELSLTRAIVMELLNHPDDAIRELSRMESLWPEWYQPYLTQGVVLQTTGRPEEARQQLETAIALGAREPTAYYYLALAIKSLAPGDNAKAYKVVADGLTWSPADAYLQAQAGKLALAMDDRSKAKTHLEEAIRLKPEMADAYWTLAALYRTTGEKEKQLKALAEVDRLNKLYPQGAASGSQKVLEEIFLLKVFSTKEVRLSFRFH